MTMSQAAVAAMIERDLLRADDSKPSNGAIDCFACGRGMTYNGSCFCGQRCRDYYDRGAPGYAQDWLRFQSGSGVTGWWVIAGPPGIEIGADYYRPIRDAFDARKNPRKRKRQVEGVAA